MKGREVRRSDVVQVGWVGRGRGGEGREQGMGSEGKGE